MIKTTIMISTNVNPLRRIERPTCFSLSIPLQETPRAVLKSRNTTRSGSFSRVEQRWGIDLGGTKIEGAVLARDDGPETLVRLREDTEGERGYEHIIGQIAKVVRRLEEETGLVRPSFIGIGTPGSRDPQTGLMRNCNSTALNDRPLLDDLKTALGIEVRMANDANCFALAEARFGATKGKRVVFGVIMGTGVGGGIVVDGEVLGGPNMIAGEWGHVPMPEVTDPQPCYCGRNGCIETVICGPAVERDFMQRTGRRLTLKKIVADPESGETLGHLYTNFGKAIAVVINILDPDAIVLGGGVGNVAGLYTQGRDEAAKHVFHPHFSTPFLPPELGDSAGVIGAALL